MYRKFLLMIAVIAISLLVMPSLLSMFSGSHTTYASTFKSCIKCHSDVAERVESGQDFVVLAHKRAANNKNYTTYLTVGGVDYSTNGTIFTNYDGDNNGVNDTWTWDSSVNKWKRTSDNKVLLVSLDMDGSGDISTFELCDLCHNSTLFGVTTSSHLNVTVRGCDDDRCHGNKNRSYNDADLFTGDVSRAVSGGYLLSINNSHMRFYLDLTNYSSGYTAGTPFNSTPGNIGPDGSHISRGYWSCLGCHSEIGVSANITETSAYPHTDAGAAKKRYI